jgi:hypothetical protein
MTGRLKDKGIGGQKKRVVIGEEDSRIGWDEGRRTLEYVGG